MKHGYWQEQFKNKSMNTSPAPWNFGLTVVFKLRLDVGYGFEI